MSAAQLAGEVFFLTGAAGSFGLATDRRILNGLGVGGAWAGLLTCGLKETAPRGVLLTKMAVP